MGDWRYTLGTSRGECLRLSDTYARVMRMNGVPARLVNRNFINEQNGHHLRSLVWLADTGWVPVEVTSAVGPPKKPALDFLGACGGPMLVGNRNVGYELLGPKGTWNIGTSRPTRIRGSGREVELPKRKNQSDGMKQRPTAA